MDNNEDNDRPLKKAKYLWQVKGRQHSRQAQDECKGRCIDRFIEKTESILDSGEESCNIDKCLAQEIPVTLVSPEPQNQEYYLVRWQARQIARGYIDNTINSVLESRMDPTQTAPFDPEDLVEKCQQNGLVEDEGILMAIQAHGLHSKDSTAPLEAPSCSENISSNRNKAVVMETSDDSPDILSGILNLAVMTAIEKNGLSNKQV